MCAPQKSTNNTRKAKALKPGTETKHKGKAQRQSAKAKAPVLPGPLKGSQNRVGNKQFRLQAVHLLREWNSSQPIVVAAIAIAPIIAAAIVVVTAAVIVIAAITTVVSEAVGVADELQLALNRVPL
jgi:hypothetical protein